MTFLGALGTIFGFASTIALIVAHDGKPPRWPFAKKYWNPKPTSEKKEEDKKDDITEEDLVADELAQIAGALTKRSLTEEDLEWQDESLFHESLFKRDGIRPWCDRLG